MGEAKRRGLLGSQARPMPNLAQFLGESRGEQFEDYVAEMARNQAWADTAATAEERIMVRLLRVMGIAAIEGLREAEAAEGGDFVGAILQLARVMGHTALCATAGACREDTPWRELATILIEEFRFGADAAADQLERQREASHG
ncbi:hypothetical protein [Bosea sp. (in: a-proteobacteria)]|uniref:hypothetical protein n=1 Tax=Bosea sp. (in: a-proteobacteria) TaxID=1871050 RepID=UPI002735C063|nr:hypothetical protein [Bosea sp. (in: a-proteobacteria)]MDP3407275.1 hypothetical protein [Bosea sp. (in: a-proteobacteria)]